MNPRVRLLVGWLVGPLVCLSQFPKRVGSYTSVLLSEHLFMLQSTEYVCNMCVGNEHLMSHFLDERGRGHHFLTPQRQRG